MTKNTPKSSPADIENAFEKLCEWFPGEAANLTKYRQEIIDLAVNDTVPAVGDSIRSVQFAAVDDEDDEVSIDELTPCTQACLMVAVDVVLFAISLFGLRVSNQERLARAMLREMGQETLRGLAAAIHNFSQAAGALAKAKALFPILGGIWSAGGFRALFKVLKSEMSWWEWAKTGVIMVAQLIAWFATDGAAFIALAVLTIMSAEQLIEDAVKAGKACS